jgi:hypothetical protein
MVGNLFDLRLYLALGCASDLKELNASLESELTPHFEFERGLCVALLSLG